MEKWEDLLASLDPNYAQGLRMPGVDDMSPMPNPDVPMQVAPPLVKTPQRAPAVVPQAPAPQQDARAIVEPYIKKKFDLGEYSDENRKALVEKNGEYDFGGRLSAAAAALGAGLMGGNAAGAGTGMLERMDAEKKGKLDAFDKGRTGLVEKFNLDEAANKVGLEDDKFNRESDLGSEETKLAQTLANKMAPGVDFSQMNARQINEKIPALQKIYDIEQRKLETQSRDADRRALLGVKQDERKEIRDQKREERDLTLAVPGYERTGEVLPKAEEAQKFRKATAFSKSLSEKLTRMRQLVQDKGSFEYGGDAGTEMEALATEIQLLGKSPELYELGVLTGPDMSLLQKITADPTSMGSLFTRDASRLKQIDSQLNSIKGKLGATAESMGYRQANGERAPGGDSGQRTVVKKQVNKKTGQTKLIYSDGSEEIQ